MKRHLKVICSLVFSVGIVGLSSPVFADSYNYTYNYNYNCNEDGRGHRPDIDRSKRKLKRVTHVKDLGTVMVGNERELQTAINEGIACIYLSDDITLTGSLNIPKGCFTIDLNGYALKFADPSYQVVIGTKWMVSEPHKVTYPGHFERRQVQKDKYTRNANGQMVLSGKELVYEDVWVPEHTETEYCTYYKYQDDVKVTIKNGYMIGADGKAGQSITKKKFFRSSVCGYNGTTPEEPVYAISGKVHLEDLLIKTGNGGNGGNGYYSKEYHIPIFGRGNGGDGGNGGNGGNAIYTDVADITAKNVDFDLGLGGIGGKGSKANPHYWLISGSKGANGVNGKSGKIINNFKKFKKLS